AFTYAYFIKETGLDKTTGTIKSALATQQHIPGFGNGTLQDVLFASKIVPERKVSSLTIQEKQTVFHEMKKTIKAMYLAGGRDQSTDLFGKLGGYKTVMTNQKSICPICNTPMTKKAYLGGKVIYCTTCQT
ncbi:MAG: endonuclease VIII, partial [Acholeplasmataceae bacterium]|nr:endonuclease VIII [Acholeplasmataceae bacterium]